MVIDEDGRCVEWDHLPRALEQNIEKNFGLLKSYPLQMLNMVLNEQIEDNRGLRPFSEINNLVQESIEVK